MEGSEQSHSISSGIVPDTYDLKRNIQLASTGLPSTLDEDTRKSQLLPKGTTTDPKDLGGNDQPANKGLPSIASNEGTAKTTPHPEGPLGDKDSGENKPPADMEPIKTTVTDPSESDEKEMFEGGEDIDKDTQVDTKVHPDLKKFNNILPLTERHLVKYIRKVSRVLFNRLTEAQWTQYEEAAISYADLKADIEGYYEENIDHREQTDKVIDAAMNSLDKNSITRGDLLNALNGVTKALKAIQDVVKEDHVDTKEPPPYTKEEHDAMEEEPTNAIPITIVKPTEILTLEVQPITIIISTSQPEPSVPQREGKAIATDDQPED
ncbi:hypothetical protein Tco_0820788 [Tanacetum coccineum]|uniref:Uncharacterized protein n=1 Tax=Tanacetum coccineum TaxID=301880 RepID=A0ABQ5AF40_9ASTR